MKVLLILIIILNGCAAGYTNHKKETFYQYYMKHHCYDRHIPYNHPNRKQKRYNYYTEQKRK